ncbi:hypothetical protein Dimus_029444, partial [Dionaea muscipula]
KIKKTSNSFLLYICQNPKTPTLPVFSHSRSTSIVRSISLPFGFILWSFILPIVHPAEHEAEWHTRLRHSTKKEPRAHESLTTATTPKKSGVWSRNWTWLRGCSRWRGAYFFNSPSRRGYSPPRRSYGDYGIRKEQSSGSLLAQTIPLDYRSEELRVPFERFGIVRDVYIPENYYSGGSVGLKLSKTKPHF